MRLLQQLQVHQRQQQPPAHQLRQLVQVPVLLQVQVHQLVRLQQQHYKNDT